MRQSHAFLLTVLLPDDESELRGRVQFIATGREATFTSMEQLSQFLTCEIRSREQAVREEKASYDARPAAANPAESA